MPTPAPPVRPDEEPRAGPPRSSSQATTALVVSIVGVFVFGIVLGPLAIYLGRKAGNEIESSQGQLTGSGKAQAAVIIGALATIGWVIFLISTVVGA